MGVLKSIASTTLKNIMQLFFLIILTLLIISSLIGLLSSAETMTSEKKQLNRSSLDSHFAIDVSELVDNVKLKSDQFREYINSGVFIKGSDVFFDNRDKIHKKIRIVDSRQIKIERLEEINNRFAITETRKYSYSNPNNKQEDFTALLGQKQNIIHDNNYILDQNLGAYRFSLSESAAMVQYFNSILKKVRINNLFIVVDKLASNFSFLYSYMNSGVFEAKFTGKDNKKKTAFMRMYPSNRNEHLPYRLEILEGGYPGDRIKKEYLDKTFYQGDQTNYKKVCGGLSIALGNSCFDDIKTQIVINQNFANANGIKIGDKITINAIENKVVGIGQSKLVAYPSIMPLFPVPDAKQTGVFWIYEQDVSDGVFDYNELFGTRSIKYGNGIFPEKIIYGRFSADLTKDEQVKIINNIKTEIMKLIPETFNQNFIYLRDNANFPGKYRLDTLDNIVLAFQSASYTLAILLVLVLILISLVATKSLIHETRDRLAIMKAIGYSKKFIIFVYSLVPALICALATICGYYLGLYFNQTLLEVVSPMLLNTISITHVSNSLLAIIVLIPIAVLVSTTILTTYFQIREPTSESLKLHDNRRPSPIYTYSKKLFPVFIRKSRIQISFLLHSFGKLIVLALLGIISTGTIFTVAIISQTAEDYSKNYLQGKNYESAIFYQPPIWNLPTSRYTLVIDDVTTYYPVNIQKLGHELNAASSTSDLSPLFDSFLNATWLKDSLLNVHLANSFDELNYPNITVGSTTFSEEEVTQLVCSAILGSRWDNLDHSKYSVSKCLLELFYKTVPNYLQERIGDNDKYSFAFGRIDFDPSNEELFTYAKYKIFSKSRELPLFQTNTDILGKGKIIGLGSSQSMIKLFDNEDYDLFSDLRQYWIDNKIVTNNHIVPVVVNQTVAGKLSITKGDYLTVDLERKEFVDLKNNDEPLYGVIRDKEGNIVTTAGEVIHNSPNAPDGQVYNYYFDDQARDLKKITLAEDKGFSKLGWREPESFSKGIRGGSFGVKLKNDRDDSDHSKIYYVIGVTNNLELDNNIMYTMQEYVNEGLKYPNTLTMGEQYSWFNGKFTNGVRSFFDVFKAQSCITQRYGAFSQESITSNFYYNPLTPCIDDVEFKTLTVNIISSLSSTLNLFLYAVLILFCILNVIVAYIINSVAAKSMKKVIVIMRAIGYKAGRILWTVSLTYIPIMILVISFTLGMLYWFFTEKAHEYLINNFVDLPINLRWWYYVVSGGAVFILFLILFLFNFSVILKRVTSEKKN